MVSNIIHTHLRCLIVSVFYIQIKVLLKNRIPGFYVSSISHIFINKTIKLDVSHFSFSDETKFLFSLSSTETEYMKHKEWIKIFFRSSVIVIDQLLIPLLFTMEECFHQSSVLLCKEHFQNSVEWIEFMSCSLFFYKTSCVPWHIVCLDSPPNSIKACLYP